MKTYIIGARYSVRIDNDNWNYGCKGHSAFSYGDTHFFKCDLDLSDLPGSLEKIQSRCKKMSRNLHGCKISFDLQGNNRSTINSQFYTIYTPTQYLLDTFVAGNWINIDDTDEITDTKTLMVRNQQATYRSKIERSIYLRDGNEYDEAIAQYDCILDRYGEFIKEVA